MTSNFETSVDYASKAAVANNATLFNGKPATDFLQTGLSSIELNPNGSLSNYGGFIDFHYNGSTADYTSRIIEESAGTITFCNTTSGGTKRIIDVDINGIKKKTVSSIPLNDWYYRPVVIQSSAPSNAAVGALWIKI